MATPNMGIAAAISAPGVAVRDWPDSTPVRPLDPSHNPEPHSDSAVPPYPAVVRRNETPSVNEEGTYYSGHSTGAASFRSAHSSFQADRQHDSSSSYPPSRPYNDVKVPIDSVPLASRSRSHSASGSGSGSGSRSGSESVTGSDLDEKEPRSKKRGKKQKKESTSAPTAGFKELFRYATIWELLFNIIGLVAAAAAGAAQPLMTIVFGDLTSSFLDYTKAQMGDGDLAAAEDKLSDEVKTGVLFLVYIGFAMLVTTYVYMASWIYVGEMVTRRIRERYLQAILRQDIAYFDNLGAGEITTRIQTDTQLIQDGISDKIPISVMFLACFVAGFIIAFIKSAKLAGAMSSIIPCIMLAGVLMNSIMAKMQQNELDHVSKAATTAEEAMSSLRTVKAFGIESKIVALYNIPNKLATKVGAVKAAVQGVGLGILFFVIYSAYALAFYFGAKLIASGEINTGVVMNVIFSILVGAFSMAMMAPNMQALSYAFGAGAKIFETIDRVPPIDSADPGGLRPHSCNGELSFRGIEFAYPARPDTTILKHFNLDVPAGKVTALVGASGSGKSTIISLVERFYDPLAGSAMLDGREIRDLNLKWLRTQIGLVSQEPSLFATTIEGNIAYGLLNTPLDKLPADRKRELIIEAAKKANAHNFISQLPKGYETMVGERGFLLSGGQKQRIAIARAIVKNPRILLLDEATSALDTQSESIVQDALDKASEGRTTITIAHRLSTIKNADNIVVMGKGIILETGTHKQLLARGGAYAQLVDAQKIRANVAETDKIDEEEEQMIALRKMASRERPSGLEKRNSRTSITSLILRKRDLEMAAQGKEKMPNLFYLLYRLGKLNKEHILPLYIPGFIASAAAGGAYPAFAILFGKALNNFAKCSNLEKGMACPEPLKSSMLDESRTWALYFFIVALLSMLAIAAQAHTLMLASTYLMEKLRNLSLIAYLRADVSYHDEEGHSSGALTNSLADNAQKVNGLVGMTLGTIIQSISTLLVGCVIALCYGWKLSLVTIACIPLTLSAGFVRLKLVVLKDAKIKAAHEGSAQRACEAATSIRTVASLTREDNCLAIYKEELKEPGKVTLHTAFYGNALYAVSQSLFFWVVGLTFWYGSKLLINGEYTSGEFFTILTAVVFGSIQAGNVFNFVPDISNAKTAAWDSVKLLDMVPEIDVEANEGIVLDRVEGHIRLEDVHFRYPTRTSVRVLRGLTLDIKPGTYCALVGPSGCGKSTTIQLVQRFYDTISGSVKIDGHNLQDLNLREIRKHMALVSQEPTLYDGTIEFNIRLGAFEDADNVTYEQLREAAAQANILTFIESLPDKWDTQVGGRGTQLSGGQKQRIAIARALIRNPKILLLDEATSALDSDSEKIVQEALDKAARGRTTIAIAHRLSTISRADRIFCLKDGVIAEAGDHKTLMSLGGIYADLVAMQELHKDS